MMITGGCLLAAFIIILQYLLGPLLPERARRIICPPLWAGRPLLEAEPQPRPHARRVQFVAPHTGRHVAGQPRTDLPRRQPLAGRAPYPVAATGELIMLADEPLPTPEQMRAEYFAPTFGEAPVMDVLAREQLAGTVLP